MEYLWLRILVCFVVVIGLTLWLYDDGAGRVYDICISAAVITVTCPVFGVLAAVSKIKNKTVFCRENGLEFTFPDNALKKLPFFLLVFVGKRNIMPRTLWKRSEPEV